MGKRKEQEEKLLDMLRTHGRLEVEDVCGAFQVSEATARRYFSELEEQGELIRIHGGVLLREESKEYSFCRKFSQMAKEKHAISEAAAKIVQDNDRVFLDTGTTLQECGNALCRRITSGQLSGITVVTNSLTYCENLATVCKVMLTGGVIRPERRDLGGVAAVRALENYRFDIAILGTDGIDAEGTLFTTDEETSMLAKVAIANSRKILVLADSTKLGHAAFVAFGSLHDSKITLLTDSGVAPVFVSYCRKNGINIVFTDKDS